jgi:hypothetical protein
VTESKNTPEDGTASTTPAEAAPAVEGTAPAGAAPAPDGTAAAPTETPAVDADATLISPPPADGEATLEAPAAPAPTSGEGGAIVEAPPAETGTEAPAAEPPTTETPAEVPAAEALTPPGAPAAGASPDASTTPETARAHTLPADPPGGALRSERINLVAASGQAMTVGVRTPLGKHVVRRFGDESNVWDAEQCVLERGADGAWQIVPGAGTTNETLLNGEAITSPRPLHDGDVIAVGRVEKGVVKLPLTARQG